MYICLTRVHDIEKVIPHWSNILAPTSSGCCRRKQRAREWVRMRLGETYLIAAEAAGRQGDFELAAKYINVIRVRAAWADGEAKDCPILGR